jgi:hypothetical protein
VRKVGGEDGEAEFDHEYELLVVSCWLKVQVRWGKCISGLGGLGFAAALERGYVVWLSIENRHDAFDVSTVGVEGM